MMQWGCDQTVSRSILWEPYHIQVNPSYPEKQSPARVIHKQAAFKWLLKEMQAVGVLKPVDHVIPWVNKFDITEK